MTIDKVSTIRIVHRSGSDHDLGRLESHDGALDVVKVQVQILRGNHFVLLILLDHPFFGAVRGLVGHFDA
eukprot:CAMPEP_0116901802 /NCGR_PEP_ID=MMETSP0467-20121206/9600_1 /TAXON_ID=283647 /ORGANISM="Mesodinium pulex, Strain SPMC105" /LENGTH=69 /DNA_ID=CAMNT_0004575445 /DNA_START=318 /DNA_END=527 /DNA_ORIENTATION=+